MENSSKSSLYLRSDLYKEVNGCRPTDFDRWNALTEAQQIAEYDVLCDELEFAMECEANDEILYSIDLEDRLNAMVKAFSITLKTAIRWDMDTNDTHDVGYWLYENGICSGKITREYQALIA